MPLIAPSCDDFLKYIGRLCCNWFNICDAVTYGCLAFIKIFLEKCFFIIGKIIITLYLCSLFRESQRNKDVYVYMSKLWGVLGSGWCGLGAKRGRVSSITWYTLSSKKKKEKARGSLWEHSHTETGKVKKPTKTMAERRKKAGAGYVKPRIFLPPPKFRATISVGNGDRKWGAWWIVIQKGKKVGRWSGKEKNKSMTNFWILLTIWATGGKKGKRKEKLFCFRQLENTFYSTQMS